MNHGAKVYHLYFWLKSPENPSLRPLSSHGGCLSTVWGISGSWGQPLMFTQVFSIVRTYMYNVHVLQNLTHLAIYFFLAPASLSPEDLIRTLSETNRTWCSNVFFSGSIFVAWPWPHVFMFRIALRGRSNPNFDFWQTFSSAIDFLFRVECDCRTSQLWKIHRKERRFPFSTSEKYTPFHHTIDMQLFG